MSVIVWCPVDQHDFASLEIKLEDKLKAWTGAGQSDWFMKTSHKQ